MRYVLGSDIGTGSCKTLLVDEHGVVVARASGLYHLSHPQPGWAEYNPDDWYQAFCGSTRQVLKTSGIHPRHIQAVCIVGITHNPVLLDKNSTVLMPSIHFNDVRSVPQCDEIAAHFGDQVLQRVKNTVGALWTFPQLAWIKQHRPDVWQHIHALHFPKDYVRYRLVRWTDPRVTDFIDASGTLLFNPQTREWIDPFLDWLNFDRAALPDVRSPFGYAGTVDEGAAFHTGLHEGTPVLVGTTDTAAEVFAAGAVSPGRGTIKLASTGRIAFVTEHPVLHQHVLNYPYLFDDLWYPGTAVKYATSAFRWLHESIWASIPNADYAVMDQAAAQVAPGSDGLLFLPHLLGQFAPQWDSQRSAAFLGMTIRHDLRHMTRAVLEGVAFAIRDALEAVRALGLDADDLFLIGAGAKSRLWAQIMADVLNRPLTIPVERDAAYGAALMAGMTAGLYPDDPIAIASFVRTEATVQPIRAHVETYDALFEIYHAADQALTPISARLFEWRSRKI